MVYTCTVVDGHGGHSGPPQKLEAASFTNFRQTFFVAASLDASKHGRQVCMLTCTASFATASAERRVFFVVAVNSDEGQDIGGPVAAEPSASSIPSTATSSATTTLPKVYRHPIPSKLCASRLLELEAAFPSVTRKKGLGSSFDSESSSDSSSDSDDDSSDSEEVARKGAQTPSKKKKTSRSGGAVNEKKQHRDVLHDDGFHKRSLVLGQSSAESDGGTSAASSAQWFPDLPTLTQHFEFTGPLEAELQSSSSSKVSYFVIPASSSEGVGGGPISSVAVSASFCYSTSLRQGATELFVPSRTLRGRTTTTSSSSSSSSTADNNHANNIASSGSLCHIPVPLNQRAGPANSRPDESTVFSFGLPRADRVSDGPNSGKSAAEMLDNMRRRHASGSFMAIVPPRTDATHVVRHGIATALPELALLSDPHTQLREEHGADKKKKNNNNNKKKQWDPFPTNKKKKPLDPSPPSTGSAVTDKHAVRMRKEVGPHPWADVRLCI